MKARDIIGLVLALILAIGVAFITRFFLVKDEKPKPVVVAPTQTTKVLIAGKDLSTGDKIQPGDLIWQEWPKNALNPVYLTEATTKMQDFVGTIVHYHINQGDPINPKDLIKRGEKSLLAAVVAPGKRAMSIDVTPSASDSGLIFPGDYVDVILSTVVSENNQQVGKSKTILKNIKILAFDTALASPADKPKTPPHVATLEVTPGQANILAAGVKEGSLSLSLHSIETDGVNLPSEIEPEAKKSEDRKIKLIRGKEISEIQVQEK